MRSHNGMNRAAGARLSGAEHGHLVSTCDNRVGQIGHDGLYTPIAIRRNLEVGRRDEHDPQWIGAIRENFSATHSRSSPRGLDSCISNSLDHDLSIPMTGHRNGVGAQYLRFSLRYVSIVTGRNRRV